MKLTIWYAASDEESPQVETGLDFNQIDQGVNAFLRDMISLRGRGVRKIMIEIEETDKVRDAD